MKIKIVTISLFFLSLWMISPFSAASQKRKSGRNTIQYFYRISRFPTDAPDTTLLRFDISIPYRDLIFVSSDSGYHASVKFNIFVTDKEHNTVFEHNWKNSVSVPTYEETRNDTAYCQFAAETQLAAGSYRIVMEAIDTNIGIPEFNEFKLKVHDYTNKKIVVGDMLLFEGAHDFSREDYRNLHPAPSNVCRHDFTLLSEVYLLDPGLSLNMKTVWFNKNKKFREDPVKVKQHGRKLILFQSYSVKETRQGRYAVQFQISGKGFKTKATELEIEILKQVQHLSEEAIDEAIEQMIYIGEGELWDSLKNAETLEQKRKYFYRFWQENYPSPDSSRNPAREEYFRRVRYVNREFNEGNEGWKTDRGRTYILYGPPNAIERSMDEMMRRMEIWSYENIERKFVFLDVNGTGTFRLIRVY